MDQETQPAGKMKKIVLEMKPIEVPEMKTSNEDWKKKTASAPPPPPPPPPQPPSYWIKPVKSITVRSVTNEEIAKFWRQKKIDEEEHFFSAIKAATRIRARNLTDENYKRFEGLLESLEDDIKEGKSKNAESVNKGNENDKEIRVGIKDWWTKSKFAYLNQPAIGVTEKPKKTSTYIPYSCFYNPLPTQLASFGVF